MEKQFENTVTISVKEYDYLRDTEKKYKENYLKEATLIDIPSGYFHSCGYFYNFDSNVYSKDKAIIELAKRNQSIAENLKERDRIIFELKRSTSRRFRHWRETDKI